MNEILIALILAYLIIIYVLFSVSFASWPLCIILILLLIFIIIQYKKIINLPTKIKNNKIKNTIYIKKEFMTNNELSFYYKIIDLEKDYNIIPQINLASIIQKADNNHFQNELFRNIDFAIFTKDYSKLLLLIEINDYTHNQKSRKERDEKVKNICNKANIKLITFYTKYPNEKEYVINRIINEINKI